MQKHSLGLTVIVSLIALRVGIGMHFFREGVNKLRDPKPFSASFFGNAKGPLAPLFHNIVWDHDGLARLDREATLRAWDQFRAQIEQHYGLNDQQKKLAASIQARSEAQLDEHLDAVAPDLIEYRGNLARRDRYLADRQLRETPSLRDQIDKIETDLRSSRTKLVAPIDLIWQSYEYSLNTVANAEQRGMLELAKPGRRLLDSEGIDRWIPWFDLTIGTLLILGLATRPAALLAAAFLASVIAAQWPTATGTVPTWPQAIELLGLLVVASTNAGRYLGFDAICWAVCCGRGTGKASGESRGTATT